MGEKMSEQQSGSEEIASESPSFRGASNFRREGKKNSRSELDTSWWSLFKVSTSCYLPALVVIVLGFAIFRIPDASSGSKEAMISLSQEQLDQKISKKIDEALSSDRQKNLEDTVAKQAIASDNSNYVLAKGYIDNQIRQEVQIQSEEVAKTEIDNLKSDWKGDLFSQISFPVVFAIASIFAAFAVKDILIEIFKDQEKIRLKQDLKNELETYFVSDVIENAIAFNFKRLAATVKEVEDYTYWLEHELLSIKINQVINGISRPDISNPEPLDSKEEKINISALESLFDRSKNALDKLSSSISNKDLLYLKSAEDRILKIKINNSNLSPESQTKLITQLKNHKESDKSELIRESLYIRIDSVFEIQMNLMITKLFRLAENATSEEKEEMDSLIDTLTRYLLQDKRKEAWERRIRFSDSGPKEKNPYKNKSD